MTISNKEFHRKKGGSSQSLARRRRRKRPSLYGRADERSLFLGCLTHASTPSAEYYSRSVLAGLILTAALIFDLRPLFILAALAAPFMAPLAGLSISMVSGTIRFFLTSMGAILVGAGLVFGLGALGGLSSDLWPAVSPLATPVSANFSWADTLLLLAGAAFLSFRLYRDPQETPRLASAALAYELYLPAALAGYGLATHSSELLQNGLIQFAIHVSLACLAGAAIFILLGLRLRLRDNHSLAGSLFLAALTCFILFAGYSLTNKSEDHAIFGAALPAISQTASLPPTEAATLPAAAQATRTFTSTLHPSETITHTAAPELTPTETNTITAVPKPYMAVVRVSSSAGAYVREEPAGTVISSILNGTWIEVLPEYEETVVNNAVWVYIRTDNGIEGWMMKDLLDIRATTPLP